jgi:cobalt-zinc-cadmium efflux system outer membrane protein
MFPEGAHRSSFVAIGVLLALVAGVAAQPGEFGVGRPAPEKPNRPVSVRVLAPAELRLPVESPALPTPSPASGSLDDMIRIAMEKHPRLSQATLAADAARGRAVQAGLYPNPVLSATADEVLDVQGRAGILTIPQISQDIVTGGKLSLSQAVAAKEVDQAVLAILAERYRVIASVRIAYFEAAAVQRRAEYLKVLLTLTTQLAARGKELYDAGNVARLNLLQLELERERVAAEYEAVERELPGALARLAAAVGVPADRPAAPLAAALDLKLPDYDLDLTREVVLKSHPEVRVAHVGIDRARIAVQRARVEPIPNVTVTGGYVRQNQNKSDDFMVGISLPVPVWNRNEGNIAAAQALFSSAVREVNRVEVDLLDRLGAGFRAYASAKRRAEMY